MSATKPSHPYREEGGWLIDSRNNRASIDYWGDAEKAAASLASLIDCDDCANCSYCSNCSNCSYCSYCSNCSYCSYCSRCSYCSYCSYCSRCSYCSYCSRCSDCSGCSRCSRCSYCSYCSRCSYCSDCSDCSRCSRCSYCSRKIGEKNAKAVVIPTIHDIHAAIYAAASQTGALDMGTWHSCGTTHCRAGWAVHLAGEAGYALEKRFNTELAAMLIYRESGAPISPCRFYDGEEAALADMKRLAEAEAA